MKPTLDSILSKALYASVGQNFIYWLYYGATPITAVYSVTPLTDSQAVAAAMAKHRRTHLSVPNMNPADIDTALRHADVVEERLRMVA